MTQPDTSHIAQPDIRVIKMLNTHISGLEYQANKIRQDLWNARCDVHRLEGVQKANEKELNQATAARIQYAPNWEALMKKDFWNGY